MKVNYKSLEIVFKYFPALHGYALKTIKFGKKALYFMRFLPGSSDLFGPPRGIYKDIESIPPPKLRMKEVKLRDGFFMNRVLPNTNSDLVKAAFADILKVESIEKKATIIQGGKYTLNKKPTVITHDDKIYLPCSPLKNEWNYKLHQSLYRLKIPKYKCLDKVILIHTPVADENYYHWINDHLPRFYWLKKLNIDLEEYILVSYTSNLPFQKFSDQKLIKHGFKFKEHLSAKDIKSFKANELIVPPSVGFSTIATHSTISLEESNSLKELFMDDEELPVYEKIVLSRKNSLRTSKDELALIAELKKIGFKEILLENYTVSQQAKFFANANFIIGLHGAGFANLHFCKPKTTVIEIFGADFIIPDFWNLANLLGLDYYAYCNDEFKIGLRHYNSRRKQKVRIKVDDFLTFYNNIANKSI
ncbi:MAG TPA: glycosyltransferase family 61 protein [Mucilaginibacter sp.]|jgi:capsular polysaccharide biosynthesis protein